MADRSSVPKYHLPGFPKKLVHPYPQVAFCISEGRSVFPKIWIIFDQASKKGGDTDPVVGLGARVMCQFLQRWINVTRSSVCRGSHWHNSSKELLKSYPIALKLKHLFLTVWRFLGSWHIFTNAYSFYSTCERAHRSLIFLALKNSHVVCVNHRVARPGSGVAGRTMDDTRPRVADGAAGAPEWTRANGQGSKKMTLPFRSGGDLAWERNHLKKNGARNLTKSIPGFGASRRKKTEICEKQFSFFGVCFSNFVATNFAHTRFVAFWLEAQVLFCCTVLPPEN